MAEWSDNQNRMLSTLETKNNPKITYYVCGCFKKTKYKNGSFNTENTLTDDLLNVTENPLRNSTDSQDSTVIVSSTHSSINTDSQEIDSTLSKVAVLTSKMRGNVRFSG